MAASPSACSCSRICPPLGRDTCTTRTSALRRLARSPRASTTFCAAQGLLTATRIRLIDCSGASCLQHLESAHPFLQLLQRLAAVTDRVLFLRRQLRRRAAKRVAGDLEQRVVAEAVRAA